MKVLVYGGTGSQGSAVVWKLLQTGHTPYVLTRNPEKAEAMRAKGAEIVVGDLADADSLYAASQQVDAVALMTPAFLPDPSQAPVYTMRAIDAAKAAGVKLIVYNTSGTVISQRTGNPMYDMRLDLIDYLHNSGVPYITIQPTAYMENLLGPWTRPAVVERDVLPYPVEEDTPLGWIATEDVGALIAEAFNHPELAGERIAVSGIENVTGPELAESFSQALGRKITYYAMPLDEFAAALDAMFGPGAGAGGKAGYQFQRDNKDLLTMWVDMRSVLEKLPVKMTSVEKWVTEHKLAFSPVQEGV